MQVAIFVLFCAILKSGNVQTTCVKTMITTGIDWVGRVDQQHKFATVTVTKLGTHKVLTLAL